MAALILARCDCEYSILTTVSLDYIEAQANQCSALCKVPCHLMDCATNVV